jgi:hypothetical protein
MMAEKLATGLICDYILAHRRGAFVEDVHGMEAVTIVAVEAAGHRTMWRLEG